MMDTDTLDVCRLCGSPEAIQINIFEPGSEYRHYIHSLLPIWIMESDNLPQKLCYRCEFKLREFYKFREQCIYTDFVLRNGEVKGEFGSPACSEKMKRPLLLTNERLESSDAAAADEEIISIYSRSPSPDSDFDSTSQNAHMRSPRSNHDNLTKEAENQSKGQKRKRKKRGECLVLLQIPDETANINETSIVDDNCNSLGINRSKSKISLIEKRVKHSENNTLHTDLAGGTEQVTNLNVKPMKDAIHTELSNKGVVKDVSNTTEIESVKQTSEKNHGGKTYNSKQNKNVPENIIVTKIPGLYNVYTCLYCERTFITRESADAHDCNVQPLQSNKLSYECELCRKGFSRQATLLAHKKHHLYLSSDDDSQ